MLLRKIGHNKIDHIEQDYFKIQSLRRNGHLENEFLNKLTPLYLKTSLSDLFEVHIL